MKKVDLTQKILEEDGSPSKYHLTRYEEDENGKQVEKDMGFQPLTLGVVIRFAVAAYTTHQTPEEVEMKYDISRKVFGKDETELTDEERKMARECIVEGRSIIHAGQALKFLK